MPATWARAIGRWSGFVRTSSTREPISVCQSNTSFKLFSGSSPNANKCQCYLWDMRWTALARSGWRSELSSWRSSARPAAHLGGRSASHQTTLPTSAAWRMSREEVCAPSIKHDLSSLARNISAGPQPEVGGWWKGTHHWGLQHRWLLLE